MRAGDHCQLGQRRLVIIGDGQLGALCLSSGYLESLLDSKVTPREETKMEFLPSLDEVRLENGFKPS